MTYLWMLFILPLIAADQRTTVNFPTNSGSSSTQKRDSNGGKTDNGGNGGDSYYVVPNPVLPERPPMMVGPPNMDVAVAQTYANPNMMGYYRTPVVGGVYGPPEPQTFQPVGPGAVFPQGTPDVPNFYFNAGFNKGIGFRVPDALTGAKYLGAGQHTPLGDLWAVKAELLPAIFKTGFFITAIIAILKVIVFLVHAKTLLLPSLISVAKPALPVASITVDRSSTKTDESTRSKREASGSPVVDPDTDFDQILSQLETIRSRFEHQD
ncbi:uncharacterized protein LOC130694955 [Daphnia carinata]|uniref:uncharacterized protein LOC130694955 n=1 Tax=Daphnia carinata TaxID=120202 RepID=UPI00257CD8E0|nr:uncharacterized protein LOC130694955 [Daphnia carinata]